MGGAVWLRTRGQLTGPQRYSRTCIRWDGTTDAIVKPANYHDFFSLSAPPPPFFLSFSFSFLSFVKTNKQVNKINVCPINVSLCSYSFWFKTHKWLKRTLNFIRQYKTLAINQPVNVLFHVCSQNIRRFSLLYKATQRQLTPSLPWYHLKTTNNSEKFEILKPFCLHFRTRMSNDFHQNA